MTDRQREKPMLFNAMRVMLAVLVGMGKHIDRSNTRSGCI